VRSFEVAQGRLSRANLGKVRPAPEDARSAVWGPEYAGKADRRVRLSTGAGKHDVAEGKEHYLSEPRPFRPGWFR